MQIASHSVMHYLASDTIESLANRTFEGIDIVRDETPTLTIWSLAME